MSYSERYKGVPRVSSSLSRTIHAELCKIAENVDFTHHRYMGKAKRNRSLGSVTALVMEIALADPEVRDKVYEKLRKHMVDNGKHWSPSFFYLDVYH
jgi:hypothetical protein